MGTPERSDHISTKSVLFKVGLKVPTPKHEVVAARRNSKGRKNRYAHIVLGLVVESGSNFTFIQWR